MSNVRASSPISRRRLIGGSAAPGGHYFRRELFVQVLNGMLGRLRRAG